MKKTVADYPELVKQWHSTKNGDLTPEKISFKSHNKVWWKCPMSSDHEWQATVAHRVNGRNCPFCAGKKVCKSNCLTATHPKIATRWHTTKNGDLTPDKVRAGSHKKAWWKCNKVEDHEWQAAINAQTRPNSGCPYCSGHKVILSNCLTTIHPHLVNEWNLIKNGNLTPFDVVANSNKKVHWKCPVAPDHEWQASVANRTRHNSGCPCCLGRIATKDNNFVITHPHIAKEWNYDKNKKHPNEYVAGSNKNVWWKCRRNHEWRTMINTRTSKNSQCPYCTNQLVTHDNCLATCKPFIAAQWHATKNGTLTPEHVTMGSCQRVWWQCPNNINHVWQTKVSSRSSTNNRNCPYCKESKGEKTIEAVLERKNINFTREVRFSDCKNQRSLPFDFCININDVIHLIEYQGRQHYLCEELWGGEYALKQIRKRDKIKVKYCQDNNIPLLVIPYWDQSKIPELIDKFTKTEVTCKLP